MSTCATCGRPSLSVLYNARLRELSDAGMSAQRGSPEASAIAETIVRWHQVEWPQIAWRVEVAAALRELRRRDEHLRGTLELLRESSAVLQQARASSQTVAA